MDNKSELELKVVCGGRDTRKVTNREKGVFIGYQKAKREKKGN